MTAAPGGLLERAVAAFNGGRPADAVPTLRALLADRPDHAEAWHVLGLIAHRAGEGERAAARLERAAALAPGVWMIQNSLGVAMRAAGRAGPAEEAYRRALDADPNAAQPAYNLANLLRARGDLAGARRFYARVLGLNPGSLDARLALAEVLLELGETDHAAAYFQGVLTLDPNREAARAGLARAMGTHAPRGDEEIERVDPLRGAFPHVVFGKGVQCTGIRHVRIGPGSCIADDVWLNVCFRGDRVRIAIGRCVLVGRRGTLSSGSYVELGDYCLLAPNVYIASSSHAYEGNLERPVHLAGVVDLGAVVIEENCWLGINSTVMGNVRVGRGSVVGANTVVREDVPPFSVVVGNPARVVKLLDPASGRWVRVRSPAELAAMLHDRDAVLPSREAYRERLRAADGGIGMGGLVAGRELHLF